MAKQRIVKDIIEAFQSAMQNIESLREFYYRSSKTLIEYKLSNETGFLPGKKLADFFDAVLDCSTAEERNAKISEVMNAELESGLAVREVCEIVSFTDGKSPLRYAMKEPYKTSKKYHPDEAKRKYDHITKYEYILVESVLSHIVVSFENFLSEIYREVLLATPLKYFENQTILLADVFKSNFQETIVDKIENEIESKMRNSLDALKLISQKEELCVDRYQSITKEFEEIYYRRNAYVHTTGRINKDYLKKVDKQYTTNKAEGELLVCDGVYINNAISSLAKIVFSITYELITRQQVSGDELSPMFEYLFERMKNKEYAFTKFAYYALSQYQQLQFRDRTMCRINYIISAKQMLEEDLVSKETGALDVSIATDDFKIAKECLSDNYEKVYTMLTETYPESFDAVAIREWPIFIGFRETTYYTDFVALHEADFEIKQVAAEAFVVQNNDDEELT